MINGIRKYGKTTTKEFDFSVLIPTWNNLEILKNCLLSIEKHSSLSIQAIIIANEGTDGTVEWLESQHYDYIHASENIGICYALNICRSLIKSDYVVYLNDDMYVLPGWDIGFQREIDAYDGRDFMFSGTMIEPMDTGNPCVIVKDYGNKLSNFQEEELLAEYKTLEKANWTGSTWPPNVVHIDVWDLVGGLSTEFSPGMYSDPDFSKKVYDAGVRNFKGIADVRVYHFGSQSTKRVKKNTGRQKFIQKWGMSSGDFTKEYLRRGSIYDGLLDEPKIDSATKIKQWIKRKLNA